MHSSQRQIGLTKRAISVRQHLLKSLMGPAKPLLLAFVCESDHLSAVQPLLSAFVGISISSDVLLACTVCSCVSLRMYWCVHACSVVHLRLFCFVCMYVRECICIFKCPVMLWNGIVSLHHF